MRLIDAKKLKKALLKLNYIFPAIVFKTIEDLATVDAEPVRHGRWLEDYETFVQDNGYESKPIHTGFVCSVCGRHSSSIEPYCHCGAKMDEVK